MAANTNKRVATKHVRDGIKANYRKDCKCAICSTDVELELHHYTTVSLLLKQYAQEKGIPISTDEEVLAMRDAFYKVHWYELVDFTVTLCAEHHKLLHKVYGTSPLLITAKKQERWVELQRNKYEARLNAPKRVKRSFKDLI